MSRGEPEVENRRRGEHHEAERREAREEIDHHAARRPLGVDPLLVGEPDPNRVPPERGGQRLADGVADQKDAEPPLPREPCSERPQDAEPADRAYRELPGQREEGDEGGDETEPPGERERLAQVHLREHVADEPH